MQSEGRQTNIQNLETRHCSVGGRSSSSTSGTWICVLVVVKNQDCGQTYHELKGKNKMRESKVMVVGANKPPICRRHCWTISKWEMLERNGATVWSAIVHQYHVLCRAVMFYGVVGCYILYGNDGLQCVAQLVCCDTISK